MASARNTDDRHAWRKCEEILIRGNYLLNRASGMNNRIMGGSVLVN